MKNQKTIEKKVVANLDKFPHLKNVKEGIEMLKNYVECLECRCKLLKEHSLEDVSSPHAVNESKIIVHETNFKIMKTNNQIAERTEYYNKYFMDVVNLFDEVEKNYDSLRKKAIMLSNDKSFHNHKALKKDLEEANEYAGKFPTNWELKFRHYVELKKLTQEKKEETQMQVVE